MRPFVAERNHVTGMKRKASTQAQGEAKKRKTLPAKPVVQAAPPAAVPKETPTKQVKTPAKPVKQTTTKQVETPVQPVKKRKENLALKKPVIEPPKPKVDSPTKLDPFQARRNQALSSPTKLQKAKPPIGLSHF